MHHRVLTARTTALLAIAGLSLSYLGCERERIDVVDDKEAEAGDDFAQAEVKAAFAKMHEAPRDPKAFRELAVTIDELRPRFNKRVADLAERQLVFAAVGPLSALADEPMADQMAALALTVWPTALNHDPKEGETPVQYLERLCGGPLAAECKYMVPEHWPLVLSALVWQRLKVRAREAYAECEMCELDPSYKEMLEKYDRHETKVSGQRRILGEGARRSAWPEAGEHASPWSGAPVLNLVSDPVQFAGEEVESSWRKRIEVRPEGVVTLGLHMDPKTESRHLRAVLDAARAAGYRIVALQARESEFPYPMREYRIAATGGKGPLAEVRAVDTVQVLVRALDRAAGEASSPAGEPPVLSVRIKR